MSARVRITSNLRGALEAYAVRFDEYEAAKKSGSFSRVAETKNECTAAWSLVHHIVLAEIARGAGT